MTYLETHPVGTPAGTKDREHCAIFQDYMEGGATCYRVCGAIPEGKAPHRIDYYSRPSHQGEDTPWVTCTGDGCEVYGEEFDQDSGVVCGYFKLWKGDGDHRDLMMVVKHE
jgi:hypothetical protein